VRVLQLYDKADLIPEGDTAAISMHSFTFSPDESKILFATKTEHIYRHSSKSEYYVYDVASKKLEARITGSISKVSPKITKTRTALGSLNMYRVLLKYTCM